MDTRLPASEMEAVHGAFKRKRTDERFYLLAEALLWRNQAIAGELDTIDGPTEEPNESQLAFATIAMLDLQVSNGGLLQFFWNCPGWVDHVPASLRSIGLPTLADEFERSTAALIAQLGTFTEFRKRDSLEAYAECSGQLDFDEFDSAYYDEQEELYARSIAFVSQRLTDFVS